MKRQRRWEARDISQCCSQCCGFCDRGVAHVDPVPAAGAADITIAADRAIVHPQPEFAKRKSSTSVGSRSAAQAAQADRSDRTYARQSKPPAQGSFTCRPIRPTSIRSRNCSPSSRRCCGRLPSVPSTVCGTASPPCSTPSLPMNAPTTSETLVTLHAKWKML
jgi:hypothetical protein